MSADPNSNDPKTEPGAMDDAATAASTEGGHPARSTGETEPATSSFSGQGSDQQSGPKAYVDPSIAAEAKIAELEAQVAELRDRYVRAYADAENLRKRTEREKADIAKYAVTGFARDMVAIADNLGRALDAASGTDEEQSGTLKALLEGVALTDQELRKSLEKHGVRAIAAEGEIFDPHRHQAVMEQDNPAVPSGTIMQVFQEGYQIEERVLRPSMVVVAKGGPKPAKANDTDQPKPGSADVMDHTVNDADPAADTSTAERPEAAAGGAGGPDSSGS